MSWTLWAHFINTLLCWVHMERQILWRGCTNARWVNVFPHPMYILLRLASKCQANLCISRQKLLYFARRSILAVHRPPAIWRGTMQSRSVSLNCHQAYLDEISKLAITGILLEAGNQRWTYDIHCCSDPKRTNNIGGRETFGRWTNLVFFSIVCPFVPFHYGREGGQKAILKLLNSLISNEKL